MKYTQPMLEKIELETNDIVLASGEGTMTVGDITITGREEEFAFDYSTLVGF